MKNKILMAGLLAFGLSVLNASAWCWLTGGGTIDGKGGEPEYSFGGNINPACKIQSAADLPSDAISWNVVDHARGLHFKALTITLGPECSGVPTESPRVSVDVLYVEGTGTVTGIDGNPMPETPVCFHLQATDIAEPGWNVDLLFLRVFDCSDEAGDHPDYIRIAGDPDHLVPVPISTGNLQMHPCK